MNVIETVDTRSDALATLIEERLGVRGQGLEQKLARAGRLLPRWVRREASRLIEAQRLAGHPKLMMQTDPQALDSAYRKCEKWLRGIDPAERRKTAILRFLGTNAVNLLLISGAFFGYLIWSGHL